MEELIKVGADTFIRIGTAGSLQKEVELGDVVITTGSIREEGTTRQYVPISYPAVADLDVTWALREAARKLGFKHHCGIGHCKDAFYIEGECGLPLVRENEAKWEAWEAEEIVDE